MESTVKERVKFFCQSVNISVREFEKRCDVSNGYFNNLKNGGIAYNKMLNIISKFPELNGDWLATGEGEMLRSTQTQTVNGHHNTATMNGDITQNYAPGSDINVMLVNEISEHRRIISKSQQQIDKSQEQIDELIGIIKELAGKIKAE